MFSASVSFWCAVLLIILTMDFVIALELKSPATDFIRHRIIQPKVHHGRTKRQISSTKDTSGVHHSEVEMTVTVDGEEYILELQLNHDLLPDGHTVRYQKNGKTILHKPGKTEIDFCQYHGAVRGRQSSRVALSTCHGVRGIIFDGEKTRYIEPAEGGEIQSQHYLYDHTDLKTKFNYGYVGGVTSNSSYDPMMIKNYNHEQSLKRTYTRSSRYKRSIDHLQVRGPYNESKQSRYVELMLVADNSEFKANGKNIDTVHRQLQEVANIINSVYSPLNIFIALVSVVVWTERDQIQIKKDGDITLNNFLNYRKTRLVEPNDNAYLLTSSRKKFKDDAVGKAYKGTMCTWEASGGVATNHSRVIGLVATTIAHEMGHNFGMAHDSNDCDCPYEKCIMNPYSTEVMPIHWSLCSLKFLALAFEKGIDYCLRNKPKRLFLSPSCGNGFVEPGEQCDCGRAAGEGDNSACVACCHSDTCMLRSNATCGAGTCCDLQTCRPKSAGTMCRSADRECDLPEYCTGHSEVCPDDVYKMDTTPCGDNQKAYCVRGSCRSHTDQCRVLWGTTGETSHHMCYASNIKGNKGGNCGYDRLRQRYKPCAASDVQCGLLQCKHLNDQLEFGMDRYTKRDYQQSFYNGTLLPCLTALIDLGLNDVDPGLVPDGAKCGPDRMCLKQRCVSVEDVRSEMYHKDPSSVCSSNCSGHGICNSKGHCHCEAGFAPPLCALPGVGGSIDSGPATDPTIQSNILVIIYVIFLGIIPSILLIILLIYYSRRNGLICWKKPKISCGNFLFCTGTAPKEYLTNKIATSSLRKSLSFKGQDTINIEIRKPSTEMPENIMSTPPEIIMPPLYCNVLHLTNNNYENLSRIPPRNMNKEDMQIASGHVSSVKPKAPMPPPKPRVIIKQRLASTSNDRVSKGQRSRLYNVENSFTYPNFLESNQNRI